MIKFIINNWQLILYSIIMITYFLWTIWRMIKNGRVNKIKNFIRQNVKTLIVEAEKFKNYTGEEKKQYCITRLKTLSQGIFDDSELDTMIEEEVALTNSVNTNKKGVANGRN